MSPTGPLSSAVRDAVDWSFIRTNSPAPAAVNGTGRDNERTQRRRRTPASGDAGPHARRTAMPIPQVNDRIKEAPVVVLRAVFAGIGQILLTADKVRARATEQVWTPDRAQERAPAPPRNGATWTEPAITGHSAMRQAPVPHSPAATKTPPAAKA